MLAQPDDVRRMLNDTSITDDNILPFLETADAWVKEAFGGAWDALVGITVTESFYDVRDLSILTLKDQNPTSVTVKQYLRAGNEATSDLFVSFPPFDILPGGRVKLQAATVVPSPSFPGAWEGRYPRTFRRVDVTYAASGIVPAPVRDAVALIAAANYDQRGVDIGGLSRETIGNYSYALERSSQRVVIPERAITLLTPFSRKLHARRIP